MQLSTEFWLQLLTYACSFAAVYGRLMVRIQVLEQKMDKHNNLVERMQAVEDRAKSNTHRIDTLDDKLEKEGL